MAHKMNRKVTVSCLTFHERQSLSASEWNAECINKSISCKCEPSNLSFFAKWNLEHLTFTICSLHITWAVQRAELALIIGAATKLWLYANFHGSYTEWKQTLFVFVGFGSLKHKLVDLMILQSFRIARSERKQMVGVGALVGRSNVLCFY